MSQTNIFRSKAMADLVQSFLERQNYLLNEGIPEQEVRRVLIEEFSTLMNVNPPNMDWRNRPEENVVPGLTMNVPTSLYPPIMFPGVHVPGPFDNAGIDGRNPDPGYAGGRDVVNNPQYQLDEPISPIPMYASPAPYSQQWDANAAQLDIEPPMHGLAPWTTERAIPEWQYNPEELGLHELLVDHDKRTGKYVPKGSTKGDLMTDKSLPAILDKARGEYLQRQSDGKIEMPHMVVDTPEMPDEPHMEVKLEETEPDLWKYIYQGHDKDDICKSFHGKVFDLSETVNRPVPPSERRGFTNTHPNCQCYWEVVSAGFEATEASEDEKDHLHHVNRIIGQKSRYGTLHKVHTDGSLYKTTTSKNPLKETIAEIRNEFTWMSDEYLNKIRALGVPGRMFLIRASNEAITDHRSEGESLRRWLSPDELHGMARTAVGKGMDINHHPEWQTNAQVLDSEFDRNTNQIQMVVNEQDPEIINAIARGSITAVSINGGSPRTERVECPSCQAQSCECFIVPEGVILGELDDIALTWVVTDPRGMTFRGQYIPPATPGVKTTVIQPL